AGGGDERRAGGEDVAEDRVARGAVSAVRPGEVEGDARAVDERGRALRQRERGLTSGDDAGRLQKAVEEEADAVRGRARRDGEPGRVLMAGEVAHLAIGGVAVEEAGDPGGAREGPKSVAGLIEEGGRRAVMGSRQEPDRSERARDREERSVELGEGAVRQEDRVGVRGELVVVLLKAAGGEELAVGGVLE